jgi:hypothetical protein
LCNDQIRVSRIYMTLNIYDLFVVRTFVIAQYGINLSVSQLMNEKEKMVHVCNIHIEYYSIIKG